MLCWGGFAKGRQSSVKTHFGTWIWLFARLAKYLNFRLLCKSNNCCGGKWAIKSSNLNNKPPTIRTNPSTVNRNYEDIKADMKSYILLQTAAIFFQFISKTGYWLRVCHGWFHLQGLHRAVRNTSRARITKWKILVHCGIRTRCLPLTKRRRYHSATKTDICRGDKSSPDFNCAIFINLPAAHGRWYEIICHELHFVDSLQAANFLIGQTAKRYKYYMTRITTNYFVTSTMCCR